MNTFPYADEESASDEEPVITYSEDSDYLLEDFFEPTPKPDAPSNNYITEKVEPIVVQRGSAQPSNVSSLLIILIIIMSILT